MAAWGRLAGRGGPQAAHRVPRSRRHDDMLPAVQPPTACCQHTDLLVRVAEDGGGGRQAQQRSNGAGGAPLCGSFQILACTVIAMGTEKAGWH